MATRRVADAAGVTRRIKELTAEARGSAEARSFAKGAVSAGATSEAERAARFRAWLDACPAEWRDFFDAP